MTRQAVLLAAGKGTRLGDRTRLIPKVMLRVNGEPVLERNVTLLRAAGVREILINLHQLPEIIQDHFGNGDRFGVSIRYRREPELLGTAGAVKNFAQDLRPEPFFVVYGDNFSSLDLGALWESHAAFRAANDATLATVGLHHREDVLQSGIAELAGDGRIVRFVEKPRREEIFSSLVNAGCYVLDPDVLNWIPADQPSDFGRDVFPRLVREQRLFGVQLAGWLRPIDTESLWQSAQSGHSQGTNP